MDAERNTKKFVNRVDDCVDESLSGYLSLHTGLRQLKGYRVIVRHDLDEYKASGNVSIITGGGSGHEPAFAGYIGSGMACCAVQGALFASPGPATVHAAINSVHSPESGGIILVFNNYTGDRLNFGLAMERARAEGKKIGVILNADDCAVIGRDKTAGRRGLAGLVLLLKVTGALAEDGKSFDEIMSVGQKLSDSLVTLGVCATPCSLPGGGYLFTIKPDEIEIGLGLHGEAGIKTSKMMSAHDTVVMMLDIITDVNNRFHVKLTPGCSMAVLLNNLGSTSELEMNILMAETIKYLECKGVRVDRAYQSRYATSQEMSAFSITLLPLNDTIKNYLDRATTAPAWMSPVLRPGGRDRSTSSVYVPAAPAHVAAQGDIACDALLPQADVQLLHSSVSAACRALIASHMHLNQLDSACGDGDCGSTLKTGAEALLDAIGSSEAPTQMVNSAKGFFREASQIVERAMGGCSGALYSLLFTAMLQQLDKPLSLETVADGVKAAITAVQTYGGAEPGDRTMLDSLHAVSVTLEASRGQSQIKNTLQQVSSAVERAALATAGMEARAGRASYVSTQHQTQPDAGAHAVSIWVKAVCGVIAAHC